MNSTLRMRCLVLGGKGFIGSHLVDALLRAGCEVRSMDRPHIETIGNLSSQFLGLEEVEGDFLSDADIENALHGCDVCFHLISTTLPKSSNADPLFDVESNVVGTLRMLNHAVKNGIKKVVFLSSGGTVYGVPNSIPIKESHSTNPTCSYGISKLAIEKYLALYHDLHGLDYAVLRLSNPFGERQRVKASQGAVAVSLGKALAGEEFEIWGDGTIVRDYIYIADVIDALLLAMNPSNEEHVFNIGSGKGMSLNDVLDEVDNATGTKIRRKYLPARPFDVPVSILDNSKAGKYLGWSPKTEFSQGLLNFTSWLRGKDGFLGN